MSQYDNHTFVILSVAKYLKIQRDISFSTKTQYDKLRAFCFLAKAQNDKNSKRDFLPHLASLHTSLRFTSFRSK